LRKAVVAIAQAFRRSSGKGILGLITGIGKIKTMIGCLIIDFLSRMEDVNTRFYAGGVK